MNEEKKVLVHIEDTITTNQEKNILERAKIILEEHTIYKNPNLIDSKQMIQHILIFDSDADGVELVINEDPQKTITSIEKKDVSAYYRGKTQ